MPAVAQHRVTTIPATAVLSIFDYRSELGPASEVTRKRQKPTASELVRAVGFFCLAGQRDR